MSARGRRWPTCPSADADGNRGHGERVAIATRGTYVHAGDRVVATVGVENLVIVDTPDAVLVAHRDHLQRVKEVVGELKARGHESYRLHKTVARPWGAYTVLRGRLPASRSSGSRSSPAPRCRCSSITGAASTGSSSRASRR